MPTPRMVTEPLKVKKIPQNVNQSPTIMIMSITNIYKWFMNKIGVREFTQPESSLTLISVKTILYRQICQCKTGTF